MQCEILSSMTVIALSHGDSAPGDGVEDCVTRTHRLGLSSGASPVIIRLDVVPLHPRSSTVSGCQLGGYPAGRDLWGGTNVAGGISEDHDRCFSMLVSGHF